MLPSLLPLCMNNGLCLDGSGDGEAQRKRPRICLHAGLFV
ncbi:hypothetical protein RDSD_002907 [Oleidesulfovibrio alaskensis]